MPTTAQHIVKSYDEELKRLTNAIIEMGGAAESQLDQAIQAVARRERPPDRGDRSCVALPSAEPS